MKDNRDFIFDELTEEGLGTYMPKHLPSMEDKLAEKRIKNKVMAGLQQEKPVWRRAKKAWIAAACCVLAVGLVGYQPIFAALSKLFHYIPGIGMYVNENEGQVYKGEIICGKLEKEGITVELKSVYAVPDEEPYGNIYGEVSFVGEGLPKIEKTEDWEKEQKLREELSKELETQFKTTLYADGKQKGGINGSKTNVDDEGQVTFYSNHIRQLYYKTDDLSGILYELTVNGFDEKLSFRLIPVDGKGEISTFGVSQELNGNTVTAKAERENDGIWMEYYIDATEDVRGVWEYSMRNFILPMPYQMNFEDGYCYVTDAEGTRKEILKRERLSSGYRFKIDAEEADFPLTLHVTPLTGIGAETKEVPLADLKEGQEIDFPYGTVKIEKLTVEDAVWEDNPQNIPYYGKKDTTQVDITYRVVPKESIRIMYAVECNIEKAFDTGSDSDWEEMQIGRTFYIESEVEKEEIKLEFHHPRYWVEGEYTLILHETQK